MVAFCGLGEECGGFVMFGVVWGLDEVGFLWGLVWWVFFVDNLIGFLGLSFWCSGIPIFGVVG